MFSFLAQRNLKKVEVSLVSAKVKPFALSPLHKGVVCGKGTERVWRAQHGPAFASTLTDM